MISLLRSVSNPDRPLPSVSQTPSPTQRQHTLTQRHPFSDKCMASPRPEALGAVILMLIIIIKPNWTNLRVPVSVALNWPFAKNICCSVMVYVQYGYHNMLCVGV